MFCSKIKIINRLLCTVTNYLRGLDSSSPVHTVGLPCRKQFLFWLVLAQFYFGLISARFLFGPGPTYSKKHNEKNICFMHTVKSLKAKKNHILFSYNKENFKKKYFSMHFSFNNQFIKVTRTWPIFQKNPNNIFFLFLVSWFTSLYVKRIPNIKKVVLVLTLERLGFTR